MEPSAPSYIERVADAQLLQALLAGEYVYILDSRQKGKSSLVARTIVKLKEQGIATVKLDLQRIGANVTPEQWYAGLLAGIGQELGNSKQLFEYWEARQSVGPLARWVGAIAEVVLSLSNQRIVIFVDEVDFVRALDFPTDEFFAGIRDCYNRRSEETGFDRLTFCLAGVATPGQLIRNPEVTPFNIGRKIELSDFTLDEIKPYAAVLASCNRDGELLAKRVHHWVNGHPYLTQLVCSHIAANTSIAAAEDVDRLVRELFFTPEARNREPNFADVERRILDPDVPGMTPDERKTQVLELYGRLLKGKGLEVSEENPVLASLLLSGIAIEQGNEIKVRNRVYELIFNEQWRKSVMPDAESRRQRRAHRLGAIRAGSVAAVIIGAMAFLVVANMKLAAERSDAIKLADANADRAERESYIRTMSIIDFEARNGKWLRVRQLLDKSKDSKFRGWEWDHWDLQLNGHIEQYKMPSWVGTILPTADGDWKVDSTGCLGAIRNKALTVIRQQEATGNGFVTPAFWGSNLGNNSWGVFDADSGRKLYSLPASRVLARTWSDLAVLELPGSLKLVRVGSRAATPAGPIPQIADLNTAFTSASRWVCLMDKRSGCTFVDRKHNRTFRIEHKAFDRNVIGIFDQAERLVYFYSLNNLVYVFDLEERRFVQKMANQGAPVACAVLSRDELKLLTAGQDGTARLWDTRSGALLHTIIGHQEGLGAVAFNSTETQVMTGSLNGDLKLWDLNRPSPVWTIREQSGQINMARLNHDASRLIAISEGKEGMCVIYDTVNRIPLSKVRIGSIPPPGLLKLSEDGGTAIVGSEGGDVWCFDLASASIRWKSTPFKDSLNAAAIAPNGEQVIVGDYAGNVAALSMKTGGLLKRRSIGADRVVGFAYHPNSDVVAMGCLSEIFVCRTSDLSTVNKYEDPIPRTVRSMVFTADGELLTARNFKVSLLSWPGLAEIREFKGHAGRVYGAFPSPSGNLLLTHGSDGTARIWNYATGALLQTLRHDSWVSTAEFSADETRVITSADDKTVKIWSVATGEQITQLPSPDSPMFCASFSGDQSTAVTGAQDGTVTVFFTRKSLPWRRYLESTRKL